MPRKRVPPGNELPEFACQLKVWRKHLRISQADLERKAGLGHNTVSRIETGETSGPHLDTIAALARGLELNPDQLQFSLPAGSQTESSKIERTQFERVLQRLNGLPQAKQQKVLSWLNETLDLLKDDES